MKGRRSSSTFSTLLLAVFLFFSFASTASSFLHRPSLVTRSATSHPRPLSMADSTVTKPEAATAGEPGDEQLPMEEEPAPKRGTLRVFGPDRKGIVAAFSQLLYGHGCGIIDSEQSTDTHTDLFFQRLHFDYATMHTDTVTLETGVREVCERFGMESVLNWNRRRKRLAIMVSKYDHCLWELLLRHKAGELDCDISVIVSNHPDLKTVADTFGIPFEVYKITKDTKKAQEAKELEMLKEVYDVDLVCLARYMQIISDDFCNAFPNQVINIHHSFLPAFIGGKPYHRAHERGVKLIGATAHYATAELDEGPIIEQVRFCQSTA